MKVFRRSKHLRRAATVVETACVAPFLILLMLGFLELGYGFLVKQNLNLAASRGARAALLPGATFSDVKANVDKAMGAAGFDDYTVSSNIDSLEDDEPYVMVEVSMSLERKTFTGKMIGGGLWDLTGKAVVWREGVEKHPN